MPIDKGAMAITRLRFLEGFAPSRGQLIAAFQSRPFEPIDPKSSVRKRAGIIPFFPSFEHCTVDLMVACVRLQSRSVDGNEVLFLARKLRKCDGESLKNLGLEVSSGRLTWKEAKTEAHRMLLQVAGFKSKLIQFIVRGRYVYVLGSPADANEVRELLATAKLKSALYAPWMDIDAPAPDIDLMRSNADPHRSSHGLAFARWLLSEGQPGALKPEGGKVTLESIENEKRLKVSLDGPVCELAYKLMKEGFYPTSACIELQERQITLDTATLTFKNFHPSAYKKPERAGNETEADRLQDYMAKVEHRVRALVSMVGQVDDLYANGYMAEVDKGKYMPDDFVKREREVQEPLFNPSEYQDSDVAEVAA